jgi:hypothetical protein
MRLSVLALLALLACGVAHARSSSHGGSYHSSSHSGTSHSSSHSGSHGGTKKATGVPRDSHGKIKRSTKAKDAFRKGHPCPSTGKKSGSCPGYVIDHVQALKHGGTDSPANMQWQSTEAAKAKDKVE